MNKATIKDYGFSIKTSDQHMIEAHAEEMGVKLTDEKWREIGREFIRIEINVLNGLKDVDGVVMVRDEGHGRFDDLIGTISVRENSEADKVIQDVIDSQETLSTGKGNIQNIIEDNQIYKRVSNEIARLIDVDINFFGDMDEGEDWDEIKDRSLMNRFS